MKTLPTLIAAYLLITLPALASPTFEDAFSPNRGATDLVVKTISEAHQSIRVAAYTFTSRPIAEALIAAYNRGVDVEVIMDESNHDQSYSALALLEQADVPTRTNNHYAIMHNKFIIIDSATLELGSFNFTKAAEEKNAENILVIKDVPDIAADYTKQWTRLWDEGAHPLKKQAHINW